MVRSHVSVVPREEGDRGPRETILSLLVDVQDKEELTDYIKCAGGLVRAIQQGRLRSVEAKLDEKTGQLVLIFKHP